MTANGEPPETMRRKRFLFTLIEVVVALALLSVALAGLLRLSINSQLRVAAAREKWERTHRLMQAAEYLLLAYDETDLSVPEDFFPYQDVVIDAVNEDLPDGALPEEFTGLDGQLPLKTLRIDLLRAADREVLDTLRIDRFSYEEEDANGGGSR